MIFAILLEPIFQYSIIIACFIQIQPQTIVLSELGRIGGGSNEETRLGLNVKVSHQYYYKNKLLSKCKLLINMHSSHHGNHFN
jgi:hypothetical protein